MKNENENDRDILKKKLDATKERDNATLRLNAAAPDMLKELEETVEAINDFQDTKYEPDDYQDAVTQLLDNIYCDFKNAIRKAKGGE